ncbi:thioesterase domain-containing protein [Streptomyces sp. NBC_00525]|uniref:thioesterase domain-containing protein n=1 Tax=Streptomyces sp. NBC_00525 TaxID=2903660 RepID=UPI002E7FE8E2|nr:thioesterase domain-containing protein [Streptomyces sp. NBC_00525]WUC97886.1 acyl-CoA dehydrogenase family protein [Streptomyces sp. NBC_00525]
MQREGERLNAYLRTRSATAGSSSLIELSRSAPSGRVLLFAHPVGGSLLAYQPLVRRLGDHRCLGVEASRRMLADGGPAESVQELARRYVESFGDDCPEIDVVCGWSFGGALTWEIACLLAARGHRPKVVLLDSTWADGEVPEWTRREAVRGFLHDALRLSGRDDEVTAESGDEAAAVLDMDPDTFAERLEIFAHNRRLVCRWRPTPGDLDVVCVRAAESLTSDWRTATTGDVRLHDLPGDHYGLLGHAGNVAAIEQIIRDDRAVPAPAEPGRSAEPGHLAEAGEHDAADLHASLAKLVDSPHWRDLVIRARRMHPDAIAEAYRELGGRGLLTPDWPREYGGGGLPTRVAIQLFEGFCATGLPDLVYALTVQIVGNFVLKSGSERLKRELLPRIGRGEEFSTVLYSEPRAGSDLAALRTRAERRGDRYVLNGVKVFSIYSDLAGSALVAARTGQGGNKYDGITLFVIDLAAEGVSVELVETVQRERMCRVRLRDVEAESWRRVGEEGRGWALLDGALAIERTGIDHVVRAARWLNALRETAGLRRELERVEGRVECATTLARAATEVFLRADVRAIDTAVAKLYTSETCQQVGHEVLRRWSTLGAMPGVDELVHEELFSALTESPGLTLSAGTSEMMLSTISADLKEECSERCLGILHRFGGELADTVLEVLEPVGAAVRVEPLFAASPARRAALAETLSDLGFDGIERPEAEGGLGLGLTLGCAISLSTGYLGYENAYQPCRLRGPGGPSHDGCAEPACRLRHAAYVLGLGIGLFRCAWEHACAREQFGRTLVDVDALMFPLIRGYAELNALSVRLREITDDVADVDEAAVRRFELVEQDAMVRVVRGAMQVLGAQGITEWSVASRFYMKCAENIGLLDREDTVADG